MEVAALMTPAPGRHRRLPSKDAKSVIQFFLGFAGFASAVLAFAEYLGWLRGVLLLLAVAAAIVAIAAWLYSGPTMRSRPTAGGVVVVVVSFLVAAGCTTAFVLNHTTDSQRLMQDWDGKFAKDVGACAQDDPASVEIPGLKPEVIGPDGTAIAQIHLRTFAKRECPPAVWAWVPWYGDPAAKLSVPEGWTVHVVVRRDKTGTKLDAPKVDQTARFQQTSASTSHRYRKFDGPLAHHKWREALVSTAKIASCHAGWGSASGAPGRRATFDRRQN